MDNYITDISLLDLNKTYSYADYLHWKFKERVELIKGKILKMSPAPNLVHQTVSKNINIILHQYLNGKTCQYFYAPADVVLVDMKKSMQENKDIFTVVQPDLFVVCDLQKIADGKKCVGAPDLVIEILSPGNSQKEMDTKFDLYQEAGVSEYWLVYPEERSINIFVLQEGKYIGLKPFSDGQLLTSTLFPDLKVETGEVFR
ncbi:Uma2 family endonuclease [Chryseobacterium caseinilyticum]|uniref:Uma2 family endonuclease n=1 Tax=Chryseobacterium caseinilyticum TaxID=2771428 RepID=A0ABR8ZCZ1_9FLAO|nr:Uma2 family endonuclease [Chryseobacterium caseinilyticum]MBD8083183.1 Uma2 family endonuclease [Chryseobacterium caseinilyticum]